MFGIQFVDTDSKKYGIKHANNKPRVLSTPFEYDIVKGNLSGKLALRKFGHNTEVAATLEDIWDGSGVYSYLTSAEIVYITSDDDTDDQTYEVQGLDANWDYQIKEVVCSGFSPVAVGGTWIRVFRIKNIGITDNAGNIYISTGPVDSDSDGVPDSGLLAQITATYNQTLMALWTVPAGYTAYLTSFYASTSSAKVTEVHLYVKPYGKVFQIKKLATINQGTTKFSYDFPLIITEKSDITIKALADAGGGDISAGFDLWYEAN